MNQNKANKKWMDKMREQGHVQICAWVPKADRVRMLRYCARLRKAAKLTENRS